MCGILGEFLFDGKQTERSKFLELLRLSKKRGPDHSGYYTNHKNFQAGFNRLSVLDLSDNGNQPITSHNGRFVMVYNGEVYNYQELKNDFARGNGNRETGQMDFGLASVFSTAVFSMDVTSFVRMPNGNSDVYKSRVIFAEMPGTESLANDAATLAQRQGANLNKSLTNFLSL